MRVKAAALVPIVDLSGSEMNLGETVTMFNDLCVMAPAALIDPAIVWEPVDAFAARARFTNAGHTIVAELMFNKEDELTNFRSDDSTRRRPTARASRRFDGPRRSETIARLGTSVWPLAAKRAGTSRVASTPTSSGRLTRSSTTCTHVSCQLSAFSCQLSVWHCSCT
jgi:hypothetical protein